VTALAFSSDGTVLATACDDGEIGLWSITDGKALPSPARDSSSAKEDWERPPFFGPNSTRLYLNRGRERTALEVWDWSTGKLSIAYQAHHGGYQAFCFSPDGAVLATAGSDGVIALLDTEESRQIGAMHANGATIIALAFSPSGNLITSGGLDRSAKLWDVKTQRELATLGGNDDRVSEVAFTPDEKSLLTLIGDGKLKVWDLRAVLGQGVLWSTTGMISGFIVSRDERAIATKDNAGGIQVWDLVSGAEIRRANTGEPNSTAGGFAISFSPKDHIVAWQGWNSVGILDYESGQTNTLPLPRFGFCTPAFSPDGRELAFAGPTNIMIWDMGTRTLRPFAATDNTVFGISFSPDGSLLATGHRGGSLALWDRASGRKISSLTGHLPDVFEVEFSPDGRMLASGGSDGTGKLWDVTATGLRLRHTLRGHIGLVDLVFSPDGRRVVSSSSDNTLKLWDSRTGLEVGTIYGPSGAVAGFAFSRDGNKLYSASQEGEVRIWRAPPFDGLEAPTREKKVKR
jgi:WD40 repeat protein